MDSKVLFEYGEKMEPRIYQPKDEFRFELEDFTHRRDVFVDMMKEEKIRKKSEESDIKKHLEAH
jgi:hypothetical protein